MSNSSRQWNCLFPEVALVTTFRGTGKPVTTPVWVAPGDGQVFFRTFAGTGKTRRLGDRGPVQVNGHPGIATRLRGLSAWKARGRLARTGPLIVCADVWYRLRLGRVVCFRVDMTGPA